MGGGTCIFMHFFIFKFYVFGNLLFYFYKTIRPWELKSETKQNKYWFFTSENWGGAAPVGSAHPGLHSSSFISSRMSSYSLNSGQCPSCSSLRVPYFCTMFTALPRLQSPHYILSLHEGPPICTHHSLNINKYVNIYFLNVSFSPKS